MYRDNLNSVVENLARKVDDLERDINILNSINEEYNKSINEEYCKSNKEQKAKKEKEFLTKYQKAIIINVVSLICFCASCFFLKQDPYHDGLFFLFYIIAFPACGFSFYLVLLGWLWGSKAVDEFFDKFDKK